MLSAMGLVRFGYREAVFLGSKHPIDTRLIRAMRLLDSNYCVPDTGRLLLQQLLLTCVNALMNDERQTAPLRSQIATTACQEGEGEGVEVQDDRAYCTVQCVEARNLCCSA